LKRNGLAVDVPPEFRRANFRQAQAASEFDIQQGPLRNRADFQQRK
jgi:hypothetical protein